MSANDEAPNDHRLRDEYNLHRRRVKRATAVFWFALGLLLGALLFTLLSGTVPRVFVLWLCAIVSCVAVLTRSKAIDRIDEIAIVDERTERGFVQ